MNLVSPILPTNRGTVVSLSLISNVKEGEAMAAFQPEQLDDEEIKTGTLNGLLKIHQDEEDAKHLQDNPSMLLGDEPLFQQMEYGLRFAGVARLYAKQVEAAAAAAAQQGEMATTMTADSSPTPTTATTVANVVNDVVVDDESSCSLFESDAALLVLQRLSQATVIIVGLGGVGSWSAEALCRSGVGHLVLIDLDDICISNTNRQVHTLSTTVGHMKIDEMKQRLHDIHPDCQITLIYDFVSKDNVHDILSSIQNKTIRSSNSSSINDKNVPSSPSLVCLDAMDAAPDKVALIAACADLKIPIVTCGGAAELSDPTQVRTADLSKVTEDYLLRACRKMLRQENGFQRGVPFHLRKRVERSHQQQSQPQQVVHAELDEKEQEQNVKTAAMMELQKKDDEDHRHVKYRTWNIDAVYSTELPPLDKSSKDDNNESAFRRCDCAAGTACFVTGTFGFVAAGRIVDMIANQQFRAPRRR
jgi:tRNA A37 threonylcarbamoyladenosine dehydratase